MPKSIVEQAEVVAGPVMGGALLAHTMAGLLDSRQHLSRPRTLFAPFSVDAECGQTLSRFYQQQVRGRKVLLVDDVLNTGQTFARCAELVRAGGGTVHRHRRDLRPHGSDRETGRAELPARRIQGTGELRHRFVPAVSVRNPDQLVLDDAMLVLLALARVRCSSCSDRRMRGSSAGRFSHRFPISTRWIVGGAVAVAALVAIVSAVGRLRRRGHSSQSATDRGSAQALGLRYALMALAVTMSAIYALVVRSGNPDVDVVEAFHFVEYGIVAYLFYRAWRSRPDLSGVVFAACAGLAVGVADEWVQWFVPGRVGEMHDVALNAVAVGCGLLFSMAVHPPASVRVPPAARSRLALGAALSGLIVAIAGFVDRVHLGYEVNDGQVGIFRSQYDARTLAAAAARSACPLECVAATGRGLQARGSLLERGAVARSAAESRRHGRRPVDGVE